MIAFSSPTYARGILLPIREIASLAQRHGIVTICDGAHLPGMFPIDLRALGIDFFASAGHNWQCGPLGTGMLYIRNRVIPEHNGLPLPEFEPMSWFGRGPDRRTAAGETIDIAARVIRFGGHNRPIWSQISQDLARATNARVGTVRLLTKAYVGHMLGKNPS